jgi:hypothetical protein
MAMRRVIAQELSVKRHSSKGRALESPARQLAGFIAKFDPAIGKLVRSARVALRKRMPTAIELVYDNYNALAIGFGSTEPASRRLLQHPADTTAPLALRSHPQDTVRQIERG